MKKPSIPKNIYSSKNDLTELVDKIEASGISIAKSYDEYLKLAIVFGKDFRPNEKGIKVYLNGDPDLNDIPKSIENSHNPRD